MNETLEYKYIKLSNGDSIVCKTNDIANLNSKTTIFVCDPVLITPIRMPKGMNIVETYIMTPWISISDEKIFELNTSQIVLATDVKEHFKDNYISFIETKEEESSKDKPTRTSNEILIKNLLGINEHEEEQDIEDEKFYVPGNRSIH